MVLATLVGIWIGILAGIVVGNLFFSKREKSGDLSRMDIRADTDASVPMPDFEGKPIPAYNRSFLDFAPLWAKWPDHDRVLWMNILLKHLWPYENYGVGAMVAQQAKQPIEDVIKKVPMGLLQSIDIEKLDLGTHPPVVTGIKSYFCTQDDAVMEMNLVWGSDMKVHIGVRVKVGPFVIYLPLHVEDVQFRATVRVSLKPLVDDLPCIGATEITLTDPVYVDLSLMLINRLDLMQMPGVKQAVNFVVNKVVGDMLLYPNKMVIDLMPGKGLPPPPRGMLAVHIIKIQGIVGGGDLISKVDPYVTLTARKGRTTRTRTIWNTKDPVFNETIAAAVDDPDEQSLHLELWEDQGGYRDVRLGELDIPVKGSKFFDNPGTPIEIKRPFTPPLVDEQMLIAFAKLGAGAVTSGVGAVGSGVTNLGKGIKSLGKKRAGDANKDGQEDGDKEKKRKPFFGGGKPKQNENKVVGTVYMRVTYVPFNITPRQLLEIEKARIMKASQEKSAAAAAVKVSEKLVKELEADLALREEGDSGCIPASDPLKKEKYFKITFSADSLRRRIEQVTEKLVEQQQKVAELDGILAVLEEDKKKREEEEKKKPKLKSAITMGPRISSSVRGILTVTLISGSSLRAHGQVDPYVELTLSDPATKRVETQLSSTYENEPNPKWGEKFDFVNISPMSILTLKVFDKKGFLESLLTLKALTGKREPVESIGTMRIAVEEVARNKTLKDNYPLQDVQSGDITLRLEWFRVELTPGTEDLADGAAAGTTGGREIRSELSLG